jgi:drug/metabolite transporter (DMT)-like permease
VTETRPRPEYGEYATPEQQAEAMGVVYEPPKEPTAQTPAVAAPAATVTATPPALKAAADLPKQPRRWDLVLSIALVVIGTYVVLSSFATYGDLPYSLTQIYAMYGYDGSYPDIERANAVGLALNIIQPALLVIAVILSSRSLRRGRITFYIPLAGGILALIVTSILLTTLFLADPSFVEFMQTDMFGTTGP